MSVRLRNLCSQEAARRWAARFGSSRYSTAPLHRAGEAGSGSSSKWDEAFLREILLNEMAVLTDGKFIPCSDASALPPKMPLWRQPVPLYMGTLSLLQSCVTDAARAVTLPPPRRKEGKFACYLLRDTEEVCAAVALLVALTGLPCSEGEGLR